MKIHLLSDLHLEFGKFKHTPPNCDVVVLAGDTHPGVKGIVWAAKRFGNVPVISIAGNHEFYHGRRQLPRHYNKMKEKADELGIIFLQNESVIIDNVRFVACTLWTDFSLVGNAPLAMLHAERTMNDYQLTREVGGGYLRAETVLAEHKKSMEFLTEELSQNFDGPTVVVTHHAPSEMSAGHHFKVDRTNAFYATNLHRFVEVMQPTVWVHGHMHSSSDYMMGDTRVITNPRGYVNNPGFNQNFDPNFVFEV